MSNLTYVATGIIEYEGTDILYAGHDIEIAFKKIREHNEKYEGMFFYQVDVWENGRIIKNYQYLEDEDEFIK